MASSLENILMPEKWCVSSSMVGVAWCGLLSTVLRCLGSRQILKLPYFLCEYARLETQSVGSVTFLIILFLTMLSSSCFIKSLSAIGVFLGASVCGCMFLLTDSLTAPGMEPILSNWSGYICIRSLIAFICAAAGVWNASSFLTVQWRVISFSSSSDGNPSSAGPCTSTMWKVLTCQSDLLYWLGILMLPKYFIGVPL